MLGGNYLLDNLCPILGMDHGKPQNWIMVVFFLSVARYCLASNAVVGFDYTAVFVADRVDIDSDGLEKTFQPRIEAPVPCRFFAAAHDNRRNLVKCFIWRGQRNHRHARAVCTHQ